MLVVFEAGGDGDGISASYHDSDNVRHFVSGYKPFEWIPEAVAIAVRGIANLVWQQRSNGAAAFQVTIVFLGSTRQSSIYEFKDTDTFADIEAIIEEQHSLMRYESGIYGDGPLESHPYQVNVYMFAAPHGENLRFTGLPTGLGTSRSDNLATFRDHGVQGWIDNKRAVIQIKNSVTNDCVYIATALGLAQQSSAKEYAKVKRMITRSDREPQPDAYMWLKDAHLQYMGGNVDISSKDDMFRYESFESLERTIDRQVIVFDVETLASKWAFKRSGSYAKIAYYCGKYREGNEPITLLRVGHHVNFVSSFKGLLSADKVCHKCACLFETKAGKTHQCGTSTKKVKTSKPIMGFVKSDEDKTKKRTEVIVAYDVETITSEGKHKPNVLCWSKIEGDQVTESGSIIAANRDDCIITHFVDLLMNKRFKGAYAIAHNGSRYNNKRDMVQR